MNIDFNDSIRLNKEILAYNLKPPQGLFETKMVEFELVNNLKKPKPKIKKTKNKNGR